MSEKNIKKIGIRDALGEYIYTDIGVDADKVDIDVSTNLAEKLVEIDNKFEDLKAGGYASKDIYGDEKINLGRKAGTVVGPYSVTIGRDVSATGTCSLAEGKDTAAKGNYSHSEGYNTTAIQDASHSEGYETTASGGASHSEGDGTKAYGHYSHSEGYKTTANGDASHAEGDSTKAIGGNSHAEGYNTQAFGRASHSEGNDTAANGDNSHSEGTSTIASGDSAHAEGYNTKANGNYAHVEGTGTKASGYASHSEGYDTTASGDSAHSEGYNTTASGNSAHVEGTGTKASGDSAHSEGYYTKASGNSAHSEGDQTLANGKASHSEGEGTIAGGENSHSEGYGTIASGQSQHVQGRYNVEDTNDRYAHIVGGGSRMERKNIHTLDWQGNAEFAGNVKCSNVLKTLTECEASTTSTDIAGASALAELTNVKTVTYSFLGSDIYDWGFYLANVIQVGKLTIINGRIQSGVNVSLPNIAWIEVMQLSAKPTDRVYGICNSPNGKDVNFSSYIDGNGKLFIAPDRELTNSGILVDILFAFQAV